MSTKQDAAVAWILAAPKGKHRTQAEASEKFDLHQSVISRALKTWRKQNPGVASPDGRRR